jgi:preprotein translocase subunit SecE
LRAGVTPQLKQAENRHKAIEKIKRMNKVSVYLKDSYKELVEKVTWPSWNQLQQSTMIVIGATLFITAIVWVMDIVCNTSLTQIYKLFKN